MKLRRATARVANSIMRPLNLSLMHVKQDFDGRLESTRHLQILFSALAEPIERWLEAQQLFARVGGTKEIKEHIEIFYLEYLRSPFRVQGGGSRFDNLLWLYLLAQATRPTVIVDSGTYTGGSAWALSLGSPGSPIFSFDLELSHLKLRKPGVKYIQCDWMKFDSAGCDVSRGLCYFDDHVDQIGRLIQAAGRGFPLAVFDDDYPVTSFAAMAHGGFALPKIEFALDSRLSDKEVISWSDRGQVHSWEVNRAYLDKGLAVIRATERLPDTSMITGIHQTPYRIVALNAA
jgi:hypothetical protein